jgi:hypothetical protein
MWGLSTSRSRLAPRRPRLPLRRRLKLLGVLGVLFVGALVFRRGQNAGRRIGGPISWPKLLWLTYTLAAWFVVPFFFWRSDRLTPARRRAYGAHLLSFSLRGLAELWLIYVTVAWIPPYGITHDLLDMALLTLMKRRAPPPLGAADRAADRFLTSIRLGLGAEVVFACLFHRAADARSGVYFAADDPYWASINRLTTLVLLVAWPDLIQVLWNGRDALFPRLPPAPDA